MPGDIRSDVTVKTLKNELFTHSTKMEIFDLTAEQLAEQAAASGLMQRLASVPLDQPFVGVARAPEHTCIFTATAVSPDALGIPSRILSGKAIKGPIEERDHVVDSIVASLRANANGVEQRHG